jgi:hypothetical protein
MNRVFLGLILGISISASAVYVEKVRFMNWSKENVKEIVRQTVAKDCYLDGDGKNINC